MRALKVVARAKIRQHGPSLNNLRNASTATAHLAACLMASRVPVELRRITCSYLSSCMNRTSTVVNDAGNQAVAIPPVVVPTSHGPDRFTSRSAMGLDVPQVPAQVSGPVTLPKCLTAAATASATSFCTLQQSRDAAIGCRLARPARLY